MTSVESPVEAEGAQTTAPRPPAETVFGLALAYLVSRALHVVAELGVADRLADGPRPVDELADLIQADGPSLYRLLRSLAAHGIFTEEEPGRFGLNPPAELLRSGFARDGVLLCGEVIGDGSWWQAVGDLRHSALTGQPSFEHRFGVNAFDYVTGRPECARWFDRGLATFSAAENPAIAAAYDFSSIEHVVDVGGGQGGFLAEILRRSPRTSGTLFDLAHVVETPDRLTQAAVENTWHVAAGDFFQSVPAGADCYALKRILHDWSDDDCVRILRACRAAMGEHARLLVVDAVIPPGNDPHPAKVMDVLMMVFGGGRERTEDEFADLFEQAGLRLKRVVPTVTTLSIVEAAPA